EVYRRLARIRKVERLDDFHRELRDRFGPPPEPVEWLLRLAELRVLAARRQVATLHLEVKGRALGRDGPASSPVVAASPRPRVPASIPTGPIDMVLGYRNARHIQKLAQLSRGRLRVVDDHSAYFRLRGDETEPLALYETLKSLLSLPAR